jgi:phage major head subunit gpT-like protein
MMNIDRGKIIDIIDPQAGTLRETVVQPPTAPENLFEVGGRRTPLWLLAATYTSTFPQLLKSGLRAILFDTYAGAPTTHEIWAEVVPSSKKSETWAEGSHVGKLPIVPEGGAYPEIELNLDRAVQIVNDKRGGIISVTEEMVMFDQVHLVREQIQDLAAAMKYTEEDYTRTTADNEIGNNYGTTTFSASGLITAFMTLRTMFDQKSGQKLNIIPDTLIVGVGCELAAKQLLLSPELRGMGDTDAVLTYGTGTKNPFRGLITQIIVSPFMAKYEWVLMKRKKAVVKQVVWDLRLTAQTQRDQAAHFEADAYRYKVSKFYGVDMKNDRFAYYSNSVTEPTVD